MSLMHDMWINYSALGKKHLEKESFNEKHPNRFSFGCPQK